MAFRSTRDTTTLLRKTKELAAIQDVELPRLYSAIGKKVASLPKVPPSLTPLVEQLRAIEATTPAVAGSSAAAQQRDACVALGRAAVEQYGSKAVPKNIAPEWMTLTERHQSLSAEIASLQKHGQPKTRWPRRLLLTTTGCAGLAAVVWVLQSFGMLAAGKQRGGWAESTPVVVGDNQVDASASSNASNDRLRVNKDAVRAFENAVAARSEEIKTECAKTLDALREKDSMNAIQSGYDAALAAWKKNAGNLVGPLEKEPILKRLPFMADRTVRQEVLEGSSAKLEQEIDGITAELARQVKSQKEAVDYAFGGLNDLGQRFNRPIDQRKQLINQSCSSLAVAFGNATTRLASRRLDVFRKAVASVEAKAAAEERARAEQLAAEQERAAERARQLAENAEKQSQRTNVGTSEQKSSKAANAEQAPAAFSRTAADARATDDQPEDMTTWQDWLAFEKDSFRWQVDSSGASNHGQVISEALAKALGPLSNKFRGSTFNGIRLKSNYADHSPPDGKVVVLPIEPYLLAVSAGDEQEDDKPISKTWALVDVKSQEIVGLKVTYFAGANETQQIVLDAFGKTPQTIEESRFDRGTYIQHWTTLRYTFPTTVVRVQFMQMAGKFQNGVTHIWVLDRNHVETSMRAYANALVNCCIWMKASRDRLGPNGYSFGAIPLLAGLRIEVDTNQRFARVCSPKQKLLCERAIAANADWRQPAFLIAGLGSFTDMHVIVCDPSASAAVTMGKHSTVTPQMGCFNLATTPANDLLQAVASVVAQAFFQPAGETISVINEESPHTAHFDVEDDISDQVKGLLHMTLGMCHKWLDKDGWLIRVERSGVISMVKDRDLR